MKITKKFGMFLSLIVLLLTTACSGGGTSEPTSEEAGNKEKEYRVGVSMPWLDQFTTSIQDAMKETAKQYPNVEFIFTNAQSDSTQQLNQIQNFITQNVDAIIFAPNDTTSAPSIVEKANNAGIPIVVANMTFDGVDKATSYVGSKSIEAGIIQMKEVAKILDGKGNIAIMNGVMGHEAQIMRTKGNKQIIEKHPEMEVVLEGTAEWDRAKGMTLMENWLNSGKKFDAVVANNDEMAIGAMMAIEAAGKLDEIVVAGVDATPIALENVKSGKIEVTVFQDAAGQGREAVKTAVAAMKGEKVDDVWVPFQLVTKENVDKYIEKHKK